MLLRGLRAGQLQQSFFQEPITHRSIKRDGWLVRLVAALLLLSASLPNASAQTTPATPRALSFGERPLPVGIMGQAFSFQFAADGGSPPLLWQLVEGNLPPGIQLNSSSGLLTGTPTSVGEFRFVIEVTDSSQPRAVAREKLVLHILAAFMSAWNPAPRLETNTLSGQLAVTNNTNNGLDLTVIVVAINEVGKAFALGYQHFTLNPHTYGLSVPFGSTLPPGAYVVHADAIAEDTDTKSIYRTYLDSLGPFTVSQI